MQRNTNDTRSTMIGRTLLGLVITVVVVVVSIAP